MATFRRRVAELGISTLHLRSGRGWSKGLRVQTLAPQPLEALLTLGIRKSSHLKARLLAEGVFERRCGRCKRTHWEGQPIPLELDHRNGDPLDNRLHNLRLLCPNCHALTPTYRGRNIGVARTRG